MHVCQTDENQMETLSRYGDNRALALHRKRGGWEATAQLSEPPKRKRTKAT